MKKIYLLVIVAVIMCFFPLVASAASEEEVKAADSLYELGLFSGVGTNSDGTPIYDLDREPNRAEAVTMLVRLLGKEEEAKAKNWDMPFTDVDNWAKPYVGYAYANGLTSGTSATTFGGKSTVTATQYLTFVLRALGYSSDSDFKWDRAWELSDQLGITQGQYASNSGFTRGDTVLVSNNSLSATLKGMDKTLIQSLGIESAKEDAEEDAKINQKDTSANKEEIITDEIPIGDKSINKYLLSLNPDRVKEAGNKDGTLWHLYWLDKDVTSTINNYMQGLPNFKWDTKDEQSETVMTGTFCRVEIYTGADNGMGYSISWVDNGKMVLNKYWQSNSTDKTQQQVQENNKKDPVNYGVTSVNNKLLAMSPNYSRGSNISHWLAWDDADKSLYKEICALLKSKGFKFAQEERMETSIASGKRVLIEIGHSSMPGHDLVYAYWVYFDDGSTQLRTVFWINAEDVK